MTTGFEKIKIEQIRSALIAIGVPEEEVNELAGKKAVVEKAIEVGVKPEDILMEETIVADFENVESSVETPEQDSNKPEKSSPEWHDYVMSLFIDGELFNGLPTINGLRRVAHLLLGEPVFSGVKQLTVTHGSSPNDPGRASCVYEVVYLDGYTERVYSGAGGSFVGNTDNEYAAFPESIAETRAESRAIRKALCLKVNSAEELTNKPTASIIEDYVVESTGEWGNDQNITPQQVKLITLMCEKLKVDVNKFINKKYHTGQDKEPQFTSIDKVPRSIAAMMIAELNKYQTMTDVSKEIPAEILA